MCHDGTYRPTLVFARKRRMSELPRLARKENTVRLSRSRDAAPPCRQTASNGAERRKERGFAFAAVLINKADLVVQWETAAVRGCIQSARLSLSLCANRTKPVTDRWLTATVTMALPRSMSKSRAFLPNAFFYGGLRLRISLGDSANSYASVPTMVLTMLLR